MDKHFGRSINSIIIQQNIHEEEHDDDGDDDDFNGIPVWAIRNAFREGI